MEASHRVDVQSTIRNRARLFWLWLLVLAIAFSWWFLDFLPPSAEALQGKGQALPGVDSVTVEEPDGDGIPFVRVENDVTVLLNDQASAREIAEVLDAYSDDLDDGDVGTLLVRFHQTKASLFTRAEIRDPTAAGLGLYEAQRDPNILRYRATGESIRVKQLPGAPSS